HYNSPAVSRMRDGFLPPHPGIFRGAHMKRTMITAVTVGLLVFVTMAGLAQAQASNQNGENPAALIKQVSAEVTQLRLEVIQQAIELQNWKIQWLERESQPIQSERQQLAEQEQAIKQLIAELEKHVGNLNPPQEGVTSEVEAIKATYTEKGLKALSIKQQLIVQREAELTDQLEKERQRLQELINRAKKLRGED